MSRINPTVRGFLIIVAVAALLTAAGQTGDLGLGIVFLILRIAFVVVLAIFLFGLWRRNRETISMWSARSRAVFYGAVGLALVDVIAAATPFWPRGARQALVFFLVLAACIFAMWRVWRDEHTYAT